MIEPGVVRLSAVGDVALGGDFAGVWEESVPQTVAGLAPILAEEDITLLSLDCTFGQGAQHNPEEYVVCAPAETLTLLQRLRINVVSQANNHSLDLGTSSLLETQQLLKERDIEHVGAGLNLEDACRPLVLDVRGVRVGFLAYSSTHPWVGGVAADERSAGVAPLDPDLIKANLCQLKGKTDCVVVSVHWGKENLHYPPPECVELGKQIIDWGARIVVGYHPHMIQGHEEYGGGHICYSLGNFLFSDYPDQRLHFLGEQRESLLVRFAITRETVSVEEFVPLEMNEDYVVSPMKGDRKSDVLQLLATWSNVVQAPDYDDYWRQLVRRAELTRLSRVFREEVVAAGWSGGTRRLLSVGGKGVRSIGRSVYEILGFGVSER